MGKSMTFKCYCTIKVPLSGYSRYSEWGFTWKDEVQSRRAGPQPQPTDHLIPTPAFRVCFPEMLSATVDEFNQSGCCSLLLVSLPTTSGRFFHRLLQHK